MNNLQNIDNIYDEFTESTAFDYVMIKLASSDTILSWSHGEIQNAETINYRTFKPEKGGLFCERIFGPTRDWDCACGKYKRIKYKGVICDRCGVEVTLSRVRRERLGHISLAVPVTHIWYYKCMPSRIGLMLDLSSRELERIIYYEDYMVTDPGDTSLKLGQILTEVELREVEHEYQAENFSVAMGAEAIQKVLEQCDLEEMVEEIREQMKTVGTKQVIKKLAKKLKLVQGFLNSKTRPEWMVLNTLPVIPPDLRPLVPLEGGRFATSDLSDLYRRIINRNNRLKDLLLLKTPEVIIRNEKRMLQEAVDALFDNGRHGRAVVSTSGRPLKSISDMLKGKSGRFRQNLLGKRVDYSGRSVIVVGPELKLHQCGLPKKMALTLFEPFIIRELKNLGFCHTVKSAKKMIDKKTHQVWDILAKVTKNHPVLLNRAPTLHRLSIQAFEPVLIEGSAIRVHPLVCTAYNADFDGDQMAVHVPLSIEAQMEARLLMLAPNNIFSPASGKPITVPSQDIILGTYYLTYLRTINETEMEEMSDKHLPIFENTTEVELAIALRKIKYHELIRLRNPDFEKETVYGDSTSKVIITSAGRVRFNEIWPEDLGFMNFNVGKKQIGEIIWQCFQVAGKEVTVQTLDKLKSLGFKEAMYSGISIGIVDMVVPDEKREQLDLAYEEIDKVNQLYKDGTVTNSERYQKVIDVWTHAGDSITNTLYRILEHNEGKDLASPLFMMVDSGARGNRAQIKQLSGMRGLMAKPSGEIIERPIISNFREGLSVLEYFISTHGARKGLADTALKTADSGYMTRKLVDVAQDVIITEDDCGSVHGIQLSAIYDGDEEVASLSSRIYGRTVCDDIISPVTNQIIAKAGETLNEAKANQIQELGFKTVRVRSVLTCQSERGCCSACYGLNLATGVSARNGEAVGIIAAQSIGEPGTQLTMRTFHVGGVAMGSAKQPIIQAKNKGIIVYNNLKTVQDKDGNWVVLNRNGSISIRNDEGLELENHPILLGAIILFKDGQAIAEEQTFVQWDPYNIPIIANNSGRVEFRDMIIGVTIASETDEATGKKGVVVTEHRDDLHPQLCIVDEKTEEVISSYSIPVGAHLSIQEKSVVTAGSQLARIPRKASKTKDITGGLPRVSELFEARRPKEACVIASISGEVSFGSNVRGKKRVVITNPETGESAVHFVRMGKAINVNEGDLVERGEQLTDGAIAPEDYLAACGIHKLQEYLVNEVQGVYRLQGVEINDKHVEIIIKQMLRRVTIVDSGDTDFLWGEQVSISLFNSTNKEVEQQGGVPAKAESMLLGITKASLETDSFISAASFQDTTRVLTEAATLGRKDHLFGFKENVIMGHLISGGTGLNEYRNVTTSVEKDATEEELSDDIVNNVEQ